MRPAVLSLFFLGSFLVTIVCLRWWQLPHYPLWVWGVLGIVGCLLMLVIIWERHVVPLQILASIMGIIIALLCVARTTHVPSIFTIDTYADEQNVTITGIITAEPDRRPMKTKYTVEVEELRTTSGTILYPVTGKVLVTDHATWPIYTIGDRVQVSGVLEKPERIETFSYDQYLSLGDVYAVMYRGKITNFRSIHVVARRVVPLHLKIRKHLFALKENFERQINRVYPEPHASFMAGLLTGSRRGIPSELIENFHTTGLTHIIAISGYNITIILSLMRGTLFWLPFKWRFFPLCIAVSAFTIFVGASASVTRAAIMGILGLLALQVGRTTDVRLSILWTLFCMLTWNPKLLWYDTGFQFSFLAVIGLTELSPILSHLFSRVTNIFAVRDSLQTTIAAQVMVVPLAILIFNRFSLVAPLANILSVPLIPLAMLFGSLGTLLSFLSYPLGQMVAYLGFLCLEWIIFVASLLSNIPYAAINITGVLPVVLFYYVLLILYLTIHTRRDSALQ